MRGVGARDQSSRGGGESGGGGGKGSIIKRRDGIWGGGGGDRGMIMTRWAGEMNRKIEGAGGGSSTSRMLSRCAIQRPAFI